MTTFVTQTYQSLQQDPQAISAVLLLELIAVQRALSNGSSVNEIPSSEGLDADFAPASSDIWINGLWFLSLVLSLLIVFLGVLAKQWLHQYDAVTSGPPRTRALIRQARYSGLRKWHVHTLIGILPIVIHISLALFFAGLVILLRSMLLNLAYFVAGIVGAVYLAYFVSNFLPIFYPFCPYRTSLTPKLYHLCSLLSLLRVRLAQVPDEPPTSPVMSQKRQRWGSFPWHLRLPQISLSAKPVRWRDAESKAFTNTGGLMEIEAASWLYTSSFNLTAQQVALEGLAGLQQDYSEGKAIKSTSQALDALNGECERLCSLREHDYATTERQLELVLRALIQTQSPLIPQNEDEYQQPKLPNGVEEFCHDNEIGPQLTTLLTCGWFERPYGLSVNVDEFLINAVETQASSPQLPAHSWVALLRAAPRSVIGNLNKKNPYKLKLTRELLTVLFKVGSFAPTEGTPTPTVAKNAVTTIHHPSQAMCLAMFDAVCIISGTYTGTPTTPPQIVLATINLLLWVGEPTTSADADAVSTANVVLDYLLQSVQPANSKIKELSTLWTSADRRNVNTTLSRFLRTDFAVSCGSVESEPSEIWRKTLALMEHVFLRADHGRASVLWLEGNPERALHVYLDYMNGNDTGGIPHSNTSPWWQRGGLELVLSAMDMGDIAIFKRMLVIDVIPALFNVWSKESQYYARDPTAPAFIKHYLASILPKDALYRKDSAAPEYQSDQTRYIHTPENLYHLSRILLHSDAVHSNENTILKLLSLDPKNLSWIQCLNMLRKWVPEKDKWENEYAMSANITRAYETIEDIQYILGIADNNLESNVDWQSRYAINTQIPDGRKRVSLFYVLFMSVHFEFIMNSSYEMSTLIWPMILRQVNVRRGIFACENYSISRLGCVGLNRVSRPNRQFPVLKACREVSAKEECIIIQSFRRNFRRHIRIQRGRYQTWVISLL